ncbi:MAG: F0F1 ATP synthase subunit epsilon [Gammaproteobacteria bacterium]
MFNLQIVSPEGLIFEGKVQKLFVTTVVGEMEILAHHAALFAKLVPGPVWVLQSDHLESSFYISGGVLEVQPEITMILADTALRSEDVNESAAQAAKERAQAMLAGASEHMDYAKAQGQLLEAMAQLRSLKKIRDRI